MARRVMMTQNNMAVDTLPPSVQTESGTLVDTVQTRLTVINILYQQLLYPQKHAQKEIRKFHETVAKNFTKNSSAHCALPTAATTSYKGQGS